VPKYRFDWASLPAGLLRQLQRDLALTGSDPALALKRSFGARPSEEFVKLAWGSLRDRWVAKDPVVRKSIVADLRARDLGRMGTKVSTARGQVAYLRSCRNSPTLRTVVLAHLLAAGEELRSPKAPATDTATARGPSGFGSTSAWASLAEALAVTLAQMEVDQYLILSVRDKPDYYVQFAQQGPSGLRVETVSNDFLEEWERLDDDAQAQLLSIGWQPPTRGKGKGRDSEASPNYFRDWALPVPYREIANLAMQTLTEVLEVRHPGLLAYKAFAKGGAEIILPNLGLVRERAAVPPEPPPPAPTSHEELLEQVKGVMKTVLGTDTIVTDAEDDIPVRGESIVTYVRVLQGEPVVSVFAPVIWDIGSPPDILQTVNAINSTIRFGRAIWDGKGVVFVAEVLGSPLVAEQLEMAFRVVAFFGDQYAKELQDRYGGRIALGQALPPKQVPTGGYL
jgi:hypothetical protein